MAASGPADRSIGKPADRLDGPEKTTGTARYSAEYPYPDLAHAALVHSTVARGRITGINTDAAARVPGVLRVLTHRNAPVLKPTPKVSQLNQHTTAPGTTVNYLNTDEVHWNGQPVAVVVAESLGAAQYAARLVSVTYGELPAVLDFPAEQDNALPDKGNLIVPGKAEKGDAQAALTTAPVTGGPVVQHTPAHLQRPRTTLRDGRLGPRPADRP
ncbi:hypothetical protein [Streptomyces sp. bgisy027]|uniref:hypothetical protein n=1 Tax=unclassified Streptomyces TaxID=2593676 RepID=UPI003D70A4EE